MPIDASYLSAFLVGLLGGVHCVGMCGGIVTALSLGLPNRIGQGAGQLPSPRLTLTLAYNFGRIASYSVVGALFGGIGALAVHGSGLRSAQTILLIIASLFMVALGLYLGGWWRGLTRIEQAGTRIWRLLEPFSRRLLPVRTPARALLLGAIWGWLPCGLVYSVLVWSIGTGDPLKGALLLFSFGLGTLPTLLTMGLFSNWITAQVRKPWVRQTAGALVAGFGVWTLVQIF
jgi:sulfite exporter TauE/SafE